MQNTTIASKLSGGGGRFTSAQDKNFWHTILFKLKRGDFFKSFSIAGANNKELLNSCNYCEPQQFTFQNDISNDKLFNISTGLPLECVIPTCWFSCPPLAGVSKSSISRRGNSKAGGGTVVPEGFVEPFTPHPSRFTRRKADIRIIRDVGKARFSDTLRAGFAFAHSAPFRKAAFTLAEVLITLGIIGVVAAMTLPALVNNYKEKELATQVKKTFSNIQNAALLAQKDLGAVGDNTFLFDVTNTHAETAKNFAKYFNGAKVCENKSQKGCSQYYYKVKYATAYKGYGDINKTYTPDGAKIILNDGSVLTIQQKTSCRRTNTGCKQDSSGNCIKDENGDTISVTEIHSDCATIFMDVNGLKRPNQFGADIYEIQVTTNKVKPGTWSAYGGTSFKNILTGNGKLQYENYTEGEK